MDALTGTQHAANERATAVIRLAGDALTELSEDQPDVLHVRDLIEQLAELLPAVARRPGVL